MSLYHELKRRNVFKVTIAYIVMAWLVMQVADVVLNNITAPGLPKYRMVPGIISKLTLATITA